MPHAVGVGLVDRVALDAREDAVLVDGAAGDAGNEARPRCRSSPTAWSGCVSAIPAVEVAHDRDGRRVRRPDRELRPGDAVDRPGMRAELLVEPGVVAFVEEKEIVGREELLPVAWRSRRLGRRARPSLFGQSSLPCGGSLPSSGRPACGLDPSRVGGQSPRSAIIGSTRTARRAGTRAATSADGREHGGRGRERAEVARPDAVEELLQADASSGASRRAPPRAPRPRGRPSAAGRARRCPAAGRRGPRGRRSRPTAARPCTRGCRRSRSRRGAARGPPAPRRSPS